MSLLYLLGDDISISLGSFMQTIHLYVFFNIRLRVRLVLLKMFYVLHCDFYTDRPKAMLLL